MSDRIPEEVLELLGSYCAEHLDSRTHVLRALTLLPKKGWRLVPRNATWDMRYAFDKERNGEDNWASMWDKAPDADDMLREEFSADGKRRVITSVMAFTNGMCMVFDQNGQQMTQYQGCTPEVLPRIRAAGYHAPVDIVDWNSKLKVGQL